MVSEIQADDDEMMEQLLRQGFLPLSTPVEKIGNSRPLLSLNLTPALWWFGTERPCPPNSCAEILPPKGMVWRWGLYEAMGSVS